jgi:hypothetical protein
MAAFTCAIAHFPRMNDYRERPVPRSRWRDHGSHRQLPKALNDAQARSWPQRADAIEINRSDL